jgi:hypothetical protein
MDEHQEPSVFCENPTIGDLFLFYLSGNVSAAEQHRIEEHIRACAECKHEFRFFSTLRTVLNSRSIQLPSR